MAEQDFITGPFGSAVPTDSPVVPAPGAPADQNKFIHDAPAVLLNDTTVSTPRWQENRVVREERAAREDSGVLAGIGAAIMTWDTTRVLQRAGRPAFDYDPKFNKFEYLNHIADQLNEDEHEYFTATAVGTESADYAMRVIKEKREALQVAGDHPIAGMVTQFLDPMWLAVPPAVKVGRMGKTAGRAVSAAGSAAIGGGIMAAGEGPHSDMEMALGLVMNGAAGAVFYTPGKGMQKLDPDFPETQLTETIKATEDGIEQQATMQWRRAVEGEGFDPAVRPFEEKAADDITVQPTEGAVVDVSTVELRRGETVEQLPGGHTFSKFITEVADGAHPVLSKAARTILDLADPKVWDMPVRLSGNARAYVSHKGYAVLRKDSNPFTVVHEAVHVATIRPIQTFIDGNAHTLGPQTRKGVEGLNNLFVKLRDEWMVETGTKKIGKDPHDHTEYAFKDLHEFTAQAASSEKFQKWLAGRPGTEAKSAWREFLTSVADILGIKTKGTKLDEVLDELNTLLTARDTQYKARDGKMAAYAPSTPFMHEFSNVFNAEAIAKAKKYADSADSSAGRVVMMKADDFLKLAYPRAKTQEALTEAQRAALAEEKRGPIRAAINKGGLDEFPSLTLDGAKVVGHDGRHRADVLQENMFDEIPVVLKGSVPPPGSKLLSETGDAEVDIPPAVLAEGATKQYAPELQPGAVNHDQKAVVGAVDKQLAKDSKVRGLGTRIMWNMQKTMSNFGEAGKKVANILYDNNADLSRHSMESHREAILDGLRQVQYGYEDLMRQAMAANGFGTLKMLNPLTSREAYAMQNKIERAVQLELFRRERLSLDGVPFASKEVPAHITKMADQLDELHKRALQEMKSAGVEGAENILERPGYLNRKWNSAMIDDVVRRFEGMGLTSEAAHGKVVDLVASSLKRVNRMDDKTAQQISAAIIDRAMRRGYFEDSVFNAPSGAGQLAELRDVLKGHMSEADIERALNVLRVSQDEAGKAGFLKMRLDLDYNTSTRVGNEVVSVADLIDGRVSTIVDQYIARVSTSAAFARMGLKKRTDIDDLRAELSHGTTREKREEALDLFDNTIAHYRGEPSGARVNENFRLYQSYGRAISLAYSGLWQMTEYATMMGQYGLLKTLKYGMKELPGFREIMRPDAATARSLETILADHSVASLRLRPFLARFEDGYEMTGNSALQLSAQTMGQLVPMANAMKYVHHHQARVVGNLILDRLEQAAKGNIKARQALAQYGLEAPVMDKLAAEIAAKGFDVDKWDDAVWEAVRPTFTKMMDTSVLKARLGDMPAFAKFDQAGKFIFTYRSFVLTAHNKILAGMLEREGAGAVGLVLMYQFPLALAAVQAKAVVAGKEPMEQDKLTQTALGQMGGLGLFSEPLKWATGQSNAFGASGLIPVDRSIKLFQAATNLDPGAGASTAMTMLPVISAVPFIRGMAEQTKE